MAQELKVRRYFSLKIATIIAMLFAFSMLAVSALAGLYFVIYSKAIFAMLPFTFLPPETHRVFIVFGSVLLLFGCTVFFFVFAIAEFLDCARDTMRSISLIGQVAQDYFLRNNSTFSKPLPPADRF